MVVLSDTRSRSWMDYSTDLRRVNKEMPLKDSTPSISVVISTYNAGSYIDDALESVWNQTIRPLEIIVVDDASNDRTAERVARLSVRSNVPLNLIRRESNFGAPSRPMNEGVQAAKGELICILDQDDVWLPTKLEKQSHVLQEMPDVSFVSSLFGILGQPVRSFFLRRAWRRRISRVMTAGSAFRWCDGETAFDLFVRFENYVAGFPGFMFRRSDWQQRQGFDESLPVAADYEFLCWLCSQGKVAFIPETHFLRREHDCNITHSEVPRVIDVVRVLARYIPPEDAAAQKSYRQSIASKVLRLAQFLAVCGHAPYANQLLNVHFEVRSCSTDLIRKALRGFQLGNIRLFERILGLANLRQVTEQQARAAVENVEQLLAEYRNMSNRSSSTFSDALHEVARESA